MKKRDILLLLFVLLPLASAEDYTGVFEINKEKVQLGTEFTLTGTVFVDNNPLNQAIATIYFKNGDIFYKTFTLILDGELSSTNSFTFDSEGNSMPDGNYEVELIIEDSFDNTLKEFDNIAEITVESGLILNLELEKTQLSPGEVLEIKGTALKKVGGEEITSGQVKILIDGEEYKTSFSGDEFRYNLAVSGMAKSYYHDLEITIQDEFGNSDSEILKFYVEPIFTRLEINIEGEEFLPSDQIKITPIIYDQAGDEISEDIELRIYDSNGKRVFRNEGSTNELISYNLPEFARPGTWEIKAKFSNDLKSEKVFNIKEVYGVNVTLDNQVITVTNIGNVVYRELFGLDIFSNGEKIDTLYKRTGLNPGDMIAIELYKELRSGDYNVYVENTNETFEAKIDDTRGFMIKFKDFLVGVTGEVVHSSGSSPSTTSTYILLILFVAAVVTLKLKIGPLRNSDKPGKRKKKKLSFKKTKIKDKFAKHANRVKTKKENEDITDLKKRILRDLDQAKIKKEEKSFSVKPIVNNPEPMKSEESSKTDILRGLQQAKAAARKSAEEYRAKAIESTETGSKRIEFDQPLTPNKGDFAHPEKLPVKEESKEESKTGGLFGMFD
ncbi:hypothetical protein HN412_01365 [archaeon]|jgi:hypothetical protein|nr:hypothetical protein [archaeon]MBT7107282.1 hypothetical protein [archaeon]MBT7297415.1 hypothetical protein [archaeon]